MNIVLVLLIIFIILEIPTCMGMKLIFKKLNLNEAIGIIPFYNRITLIKKYKLPMYHMTLVFIPILGLYTNYVIYNKIAKEYKLDKLYVIELTLFPFVYNFFLGLELKQEEPKEKEEEPKEIEQDKYTWQPEKKERSSSVYKASRNSLNAKVNVKLNNDENIIDNKEKFKKYKENQKTCPNCGAKVPEKTEICFVCGTKV